MKSGRIFGLLSLVLVLAWQPGCHKKESTTPPPPGDDLEQTAADSNQEAAEDQDTGPNPSPENIEAVQRVFRLGRMELEQCFNDLLNRTKNSNLKGYVIVAVKVGSRPQPTEVKIFKSSPSLKDPTFVKCVIDRVKTWEFPVWGGQLELTSPKFSFLGS